MKPLKPTKVHRYFELADSFLEVRVVDRETFCLQSPAHLDRASYRRMVIDTCLPAFEGDVDARIEGLFPEDPMLAEDLLYRLCVDVNPELEIHRVSLRAGEEVASRVMPAAGAGGAEDWEGFLGQLRRRARTLGDRLSRRIHGQHEAIEAVQRSIASAAVGLGVKHRPLASFLFVGRTGTGKTELARALATELFGEGPEHLVRIDCSEYGQAHETARLLGAPPGYVGHEGGGQLFQALSGKQGRVVVFDEIEKAHPRLHHLLLQVLEEASLTDGQGRRVGFEHTVVVLTSNAGAHEMSAASRTVGFHRDRQLGRETLLDITRRALENEFRPELLGRVDDVLLFEELSPESVRRIAEDQLTELAVRARRRGPVVAFTPAVAKWIAERGWSPEYGARELRAVIQREIEPRLAELLLSDDLRASQLLRVRIKSGAPTFELED
ncbi:MAG: ATP-dependent Clp protease ATP-binding subunit [Planctomycetes bacterium]|nr:ATP-dependent Clp protease ATP-binding subunit [Planctomycetota bacterium]MCB9904813.1 ATP-dependent Clp protease ATP-binding subunit [Planctomycetota bacterium]